MKKLSLFLLIVFFMILCSCNTSESEKTIQSKKPSEAKIKLKLLCQPRPSFIPIHIALEEGYFDQEGLEIEFVHANQGPKALFLLAKGELDVWAGGSRAGFLNIFSQKVDIRIVANKGIARSQDGTIQKAIVFRKNLIEPDKPFPIEKLKGLKAYIDMGSYEEYHIDCCLQKAGLTIKDIESDRMPDNMASEALINGSIDFVSLGEPLLTLLSKRGNFDLRFTTEEIIPDFEFGYIMYGERLLRREPELGKKFMVAYLKGVRQYMQGKTDRNVEIMMKHTKHDKETCLKMGWPLIKIDGTVNLESLKKFQNWCLSRGYIKERIEESQLYDSRFVEYAKQIFEKLDKK